ncbi:MAG TPA: carbamate kinase [Solirubrobacteraceae bacterium]
MRVLAALGGNALIRRSQRAEAEVQRENIAVAASSLAALARDHELVVTHGNGPQVGLLALQSAAYHGTRPYPLDVLGAESEGMIGYMLEQALLNELPRRNVASLLTQVVVDRGDPAFENPSKPIGPTYERAEAERLAAERGIAIAPDGDSFRRVVPSPEPRRIVELASIRILLEAGVLVICAGGGGVPVVEVDGGALEGVEAVIDKDLAAALLARELGAEVLLLLTDVGAVQVGWGTPEAVELRTATPERIRGLGLASGSMGPKAEAAARFAEGGGRAVIAALDAAGEAIAGNAGTVIELAA